MLRSVAGRCWLPQFSIQVCSNLYKVSFPIHCLPSLISCDSIIKSLNHVTKGFMSALQGGLFPCSYSEECCLIEKSLSKFIVNICEENSSVI